MPGVRRRGPGDGGPELFHYIQQPVGRDRSRPYTQRAKVLRPDHVRAANEKGKIKRVQIAVGRTHADAPVLARFNVLEIVEILLCKGAYRRDPGGAAGSGNEHDFGLRHGHQVSEVRSRKLPVPLDYLVDKRICAQIFKALEIPRLIAVFIKTFFVIRGIMIGERQVFFQFLQLQRFQFWPWKRFEFLFPVFFFHDLTILIFCLIFRRCRRRSFVPPEQARSEWPP